MNRGVARQANKVSAPPRIQSGRRESTRSRDRVLRSPLVNFDVKATQSLSHPGFSAGVPTQTCSRRSYTPEEDRK